MGTSEKLLSLRSIEHARTAEGHRKAFPRRPSGETRACGGGEGGFSEPPVCFRRSTEQFFPSLLGFCGGLLVPLHAEAAAPPSPGSFFMDVCWTGFACINNAQITANLITAAFASITFVAVSIFLVGTVLWVFSAGNDTLLQKGKGMMQYSLIGLALVVGSYGIYRTVVFIVYG